MEQLLVHDRRFHAETEDVMSNEKKQVTLSTRDEIGSHSSNVTFDKNSLSSTKIV